MDKEVKKELEEIKERLRKLEDFRNPIPNVPFSPFPYDPVGKPKYPPVPTYTKCYRCGMEFELGKTDFYWCSRFGCPMQAQITC